MEQVILVDEHDNAVGAMEKIEAHKKGLLHRAFSLLIFNSKNEMLLQKRAASKYILLDFGPTHVAAIPDQRKQ